MNLPRPLGVRRDIARLGLREPRCPGIAIEGTLDAKSPEPLLLPESIDDRNLFNRVFTEKIHHPPRIGLLLRMKSIIGSQRFTIGATGISRWVLVVRPAAHRTAQRRLAERHIAVC